MPTLTAAFDSICYLGKWPSAAVVQTLSKRVDLLLRGFAPRFVKQLFAQRLARYEMADQLDELQVLWGHPL